MGLTVAPSLPPLLISLSMSDTMTTGPLGSLFRMVLSFFSLLFSTNFFMDESGICRCEKGLQHRQRGRVKGVFINLLLNHGVRELHGIYFFVSAQVASVGCMCSVIVHFLHCICVCDYDGHHKSLIMLSHSVMVRRSHLLARCYLDTMCMCMTVVRCSAIEGISHRYHHCGPVCMLEDKG
jgi:hypothetical protein